MTRTLVIQSHTEPLPVGWLRDCIASVRDWAAACGCDYRYIGDQLFAALPPDLRARTAAQPVVAADLARLYALRAALCGGYDAAVWCDADFLVFAPQHLALPDTDTDFALGREVWVQPAGGSAGALRVYTKVHNAFLFFRRANGFLEFYIGAAERLLRAHAARPFAPQFLGPKFLTAIHNIARCPVVETAGMLAPAVRADVLEGAGPALDLFRQNSPAPIAGANLCASLRERHRHDDRAVARVIDVLRGKAAPL